MEYKDYKNYNCYTMSAVSVRTLDQLRPYLMDPASAGPEEAYFMIRGNPNITIWPSCLYGQEYNKSVGHYHKHDEPETYWVLYGKALFVLQKRSTSLQGIEAVRLVRLKAGDELDIEAGWGHAMVNVGDTALVTRDDAPADASHSQNDYESIKEKQGMAYYIVKGTDGNPQAVPNPRYGNVGKPVWQGNW